MKFPIIKVTLEDLILDPNNPRFSKNEHELIDVESKFAEQEVQNLTLLKMTTGDQFDVDSLAASIKNNGYVSLVQPMLVRKINDKFLVIEGNRRTSALKTLKIKHNSGQKKHILHQELLDSMDSLEVVDCTEASKDEVDILLGMIHVGGTKDWELLPSSFYIYGLFADELCQKHGWDRDEVEERFVYDAGLAKNVAAKASVKIGKVRESLKVYRVFKQLVDEADERGMVESTITHRKASLISESVRGKVFEDYFGFNTYTYSMSQDGLEKWLNLVIGDDEHKGVIDNPADLRAFKKVLGEGAPSHCDAVYIDRRKPEQVLADVQTLQNERTLNSNLKMAISELGKIDIDGLGVFAEADKELLSQIEDKVKRIRAASSI